MKKHYFILLFLSLISTAIMAQTGTVTGKVLDVSTHKPLPFVTVAIQGTTIGANSDDAGVFIIKNVPPGIYNVIASAVGYQTKTKFEVEVSNSKPAYIEFEIEASSTDLQEVQVKPKAFIKREESPISVRSIGVNEIQRYPGGNRDISRVIQSLPGVGFSTGFRNDLIIRGGSTAENKFYLDDIEIPNINHFTTQGGSGGPVGLINVDFIRDVNFYSSAFPANRGNMLSSAMDIKLRDGREDRWGGALTLGITESAASMEAPLNKKKTATVLASFRGSYYNWFFKLLDVGIFPNYNDAQIKVKWKITPKDEFTFLSLTACDIFKLNLNANKTEEQKYTLKVLPENNQWSYTTGIKYNHYFENSFLTLVLSRSELINKFAKYPNNDHSQAKTTDYKSTEAENKLRAEYTIRKNGWKLNTGVSYELARYYNYSNFIGPYFVYNYTSKLYIHKYGAFAQVSKSVAKDKVSLSLGLRFDGNSYNKSMANLLNQVSPRFAMSVAIGKNVHWNFNTGYYHQTPAYTVFGYRDTLGNLVNQNRITYMRNLHLVTGFEYATSFNSRVSVEGFYKQYFNLPFLLDDSISLANRGSDFGVVGNNPAISTSKGRSYGVEVLYEQKLYKGWFGILSYTLFWSQFQDKYGKYASSSWDTRHIISFTVGKKLKHNWELGARYRIQGGNPYTPYNIIYSSIIPVYNANPGGVLDYNQLNALRLPWFHQLDVRVTKKWYLRQWALELYLDVQNVYFHQQQELGNLTLDLDAAGNPQMDPAHPGSYKLKILENKGGILQPALGLIITY